MDLDGLMALVDSQMAEVIQTDVDVLREASTHILGAGGKRLRPRILLLSYLAAGGNQPARAVPVAAAIEIIHTATLVHDDINDQSAVRRGRPTVNARWGRTFALLTGDYLFTKAYQMMVAAGPRFNDLLAEACVALVEGETLQADAAKSGRLDRETYLKIISRKTAVLFATAARMGAELADTGYTYVQALGNYAFDVGLAFQITDDVLDLVGNPALMGKPTGEDAPQGKLGLATLASPGGSRTTANGRDTVDALADELLSSGAVEIAVTLARHYAESARQALVALPPSPARETLQELAMKAVERDR